MKNPNATPYPEEQTILIMGEVRSGAALADYLTAQGLRIVVSRNPEQALLEARMDRPDLILLGALPDVDKAGYVSLCHRFKAQEGGYDIPIIFLSASAATHAEIDILKAGAVDVMVGHLPLEEIWLRLRPHLQARAMEKHIARQDAQFQADLAARKMVQSLHAGQSKLLEMIARDEPLTDTLTRLMLLIESQSEGLFCSVLLLDEDGVHMHPSAGPNLPESYMQALDGFAIGPMVGSCGTAMYRKETVIVTDLLEDPLWTPYKGLIKPHGFRACWSTPIFLDRETVLGSFAMYYRDVRSPGPAELNLMGVATHIAGIAIERKRREDELRRHRDHLEELIKERTAELNVAKERAESGMVALTHANQELASALNTLSIAQEELVHSKKLAALGSLVAGIAHELNTPIGNGLMAASTLTDRASTLADHYNQGGGLKRSELESYIGDTLKAGEILTRNLHRAANLVTSFKQVAVDQSSSKRRTFMLDEVIAEIILTLLPTFKKTPYVVKQNIAEDLLFDSYPGPLGQVLTNLVNNALLHGFEGRTSGTVSVVARSTQAGWVELTVTDDGIGIPALNIERIFDPFFTTKLGAGGSGLGLNITHNIVTAVLGGHIGVQSEVGHGTTFVLSLPMVAPQDRDS